MLQSVLEPMRIRHQYDACGLRVESRTQYGLLSEGIKTREYNEQGDPVSETSEQRQREYGPNDTGELAPTAGSEQVSRSETRFHYEYDEGGNWTSKTVEGRSTSDGEFSISSIEKRHILYFESVSPSLLQVQR